MKLLFYLRSLISVLLFFPLLVAVLSIMLILVANLRLPFQWVQWIPSFWAKATCQLLGVRLVIEGLDKIPAGGCLVLFNHRSFFDIFAIQAALPDLRFGSKIELFSIPLFGAAMKAVGVLPIARGNVQEVIRVYQAAEPRIRGGQQFALAPEGTRNNSSQALLPFKAGPFLFAIGAQAPIVPCVVFGAAEAWPKGSLVPNPSHWTLTVKVRFLEPVVPIPTDRSQNQLVAKEKDRLQEIVYSRMRAELEAEGS